MKTFEHTGQRLSTFTFNNMDECTYIPLSNRKTINYLIKFKTIYVKKAEIHAIWKEMMFSPNVFPELLHFVFRNLLII